MRFKKKTLKVLHKSKFWGIVLYVSVFIILLFNLSSLRPVKDISLLGTYDSTFLINHVDEML